MMDESKSTQNEIERLNQQGEECMKRQDAPAAVSFYTQAIDLMSAGSRVDSHLEAKIWVNRSAAYMEMEKYRDALLDARKAIHTRPKWYKGHLQFSKAREQEKEYGNSLRMHQQALKFAIDDHNCNKTPENESIVYQTLLSQCLLIIRAKEQDVQLAKKYFYGTTKQFKTLNTMLEIIATENRYDIMLSFLQLNLEESTQKMIKEMIVDTYVADQWYTSQEEACIVGFKAGILTQQDFCFASCKTPLQLAVLHSAHTGFLNRFLVYLLENHFTTKEQVEVLDGCGNSIMHLIFAICDPEKNLHHATKTLELLLTFDHVDLMMKDKRGCAVIEYQKFYNFPVLGAMVQSLHRRRERARLAIDDKLQERNNAIESIDQTDDTMPKKGAEYQERRQWRENKRCNSDLSDAKEMSSTEAKQQTPDTEYLKSQGDDSMKRGDATTAITFYTQALDAMSDRTNDDKQLEAKIWSNRSAAYFKICSYQQALSDAKRATTAWPEWYKGYIRMAKAQEALEKYAESLKMHHKALQCTLEHHNNEQTVTSKLIFVETLISQSELITRITDEDEQIALNGFDETADYFDYVDTFFKQLAENNRYDLLLSFLRLSHDKTTSDRIKQNIMTSYMCVEYPKQEEICILGLQKGLLTLEDFNAPYRGIYTPLHVAVSSSARSGATKLLEYLLKNHYTSEKQVEVFDASGLTIMHNLFCVCGTHNRKSEVIATFKCLASFSHVNLMMKDVHGRSAVDLPRVNEISFLRDMVLAEHRKRVEAAVCGKTGARSQIDERKPDSCSNKSPPSTKEKVRTSNATIPRDTGERNSDKAKKSRKRNKKKTRAKEVTFENVSKDGENTCTDEDNAIVCIGPKKKDNYEATSLETVDPIGNKETTQDELEKQNQRFAEEIQKIQERITTLKFHNEPQHSGTNTEVVRCTIPDTGVKIEVPLGNLPEVLAKLGVIKLYE